MSATNLTQQSSEEHENSQPGAMASDSETPEQALARAHPAALALQGIIRGMAGNPEAAVSLLGKAITLQPENAAWHAHLSFFCRATYRLDEALVASQESIQ